MHKLTDKIETVTCKLGNMRKDEEFVIYPRKDGNIVTIQSDHRIARIDLSSKKAVLSKYRSGGAYFSHLSPLMGATIVDVPQDLIEKLLPPMHITDAGLAMDAAHYLASYRPVP